MAVIIFKFQCSECQREILTDGVVAKCCNRLMQQKETYHLTEDEVKSLLLSDDQHRDVT